MVIIIGPDFLKAVRRRRRMAERPPENGASRLSHNSLTGPPKKEGERHSTGERDHTLMPSLEETIHPPVERNSDVLDDTPRSSDMARPREPPKSILIFVRHTWVDRLLDEKDCRCARRVGRAKPVHPIDVQRPWRHVGLGPMLSKNTLFRLAFIAGRAFFVLFLARRRSLVANTTLGLPCRSRKRGAHSTCWRAE